MKQAILDSIKKEYNENKKKQEEVKEKQKRKAELKDNEFVKEYLNLCRELRDIDLKKLNQPDSEMLVRAYRNYNNDETNGIYVYGGTYERSYEIDIVHGSTDNIVDRNSPDADYRLYINLEKHYDTENIPIAQCDEFEKNHKIIIPKSCMPYDEFYNIQKEFIELAVKLGQEEACIQMLEKYK